MQIVTPPPTDTRNVTFAPVKMERQLHIRLANSQDSFQLTLVDGAEPASLALAVSARVGADRWYLTATADRNAPLVPLTAALTDGTSLVLHLPPAPHATSGADVALTPAAAAPSATMAAANSSTLRAPLLTSAIISETHVPSQARATSFHRSSTGSVVSQQLEGLERLNRLTTDLANERTLLAWVHLPRPATPLARLQRQIRRACNFVFRFRRRHSAAE